MYCYFWKTHYPCLLSYQNYVVKSICSTLSHTKEFRCSMTAFIKLLKKHTHWMSSGSWVRGQVLGRDMREPGTLQEPLSVGNADGSCAVRWVAVVWGETRAKAGGADSLPGFLRRAFVHLVSWCFCVLEVTLVAFQVPRNAGEMWPRQPP